MPKAHTEMKKALQLRSCRAFQFLAERTGLEPATPGVTGRYSNQLNYRSNKYRYSITVTAQV